MYVSCALCFQVEASATDRSLVMRTPAECVYHCALSRVTVTLYRYISREKEIREGLEKKGIILHYINTTSEREVPALMSAKIRFCPVYYNGSAAIISLEVQMSALFFFFFRFWCENPPADHGLLIPELSRSHKTTHHIR
jgi:hypothetical protein